MVFLYLLGGFWAVSVIFALIGISRVVYHARKEDMNGKL